MATLHCYAEAKDVCGIIERFCKEYHTQLHRVSDHAYRCLITGHWHSPDMEIRVHGGRPPVTVILSITLSKQARRTMFGLVFVGCGCATLAIAWLFVLGAYALVGLSIGVLLLASMMKLLDSTCRRASQAASRLTDALKSSMRVVQISPLRLFESCALRSQAALAIALLGAFVLALAVTFGLLLTAVVSIGFGVMISAVFLVVRLKHSWRGSLAALQMAWSFPNWAALLLTVFIGLVAFVEYATAIGMLDHSGESVVFVEKEAQGLLADWSFAHESPKDFAIEILTAIEAREIPSGAPQEDRLPMKNIPILFGAFLLACSLFALLTVLQFVTARRTWRLGVINPSADRAVLPAAEARSGSVLDAVVVVVFALLIGFLHWICAIIAIDAVSVAIVDRCLIYEPLGWMLALFMLYAQLLTGSSGSWAALISIAVVLPIVLPGVVNLLLTSQRIFRLIFSGITLQGERLTPGGNGADDLVSFVEKTCDECGIHVPVVRVRPDTRPYIYSEAGVFRSRGKIILSSACRTLLDGEELKALAAHEIHHLKRDARMVKHLKLFSAALLSPLNLLVMLFDFERSEREAHLFAASTMNGSRSLRSALVKLAAANLASGVAADTSNPRDSVAKGRSRSKTRGPGLLSLYLDDSLLGAAYPTVSERIAWLQTIDPTCGSEQRYGH